ncbi:unnamed protein product [Laminaria digitata]
MALDSSVLGCNSDDWSVDGDYYAFQDFPDDAHHRKEHQRSASDPDRVLRRDARGAAGGRGRGSRVIIRAGNRKEGQEKEGLHVHVESESGEAGAKAEEGGLLPELQALVVSTEGNAVVSGQEEQHPGPSDARLLRDPGSSTDSTQILRLEQRMFLKAAFQLLEERDRLFPASFGSWSAGNGGTAGGDPDQKGGGGGGGGGGCGGDGGAIVASGHTAEKRVRLQASGSGHRYTIRSGTLRKATARSVGRLETTTWKTKYVELTPGKFAYADASSVLGKRCERCLKHL